MEIPNQFLQVHYEKNVVPHDRSKGNIQVRICKVFKIVRYTLTISIHYFRFLKGGSHASDHMWSKWKSP